MTRDTVGRPERTGLLLAGGRSTRFGEPDKALAELAGAPLLSHTAAALAPVVDELVINCRADQRDGLAAALDGLDDVRFAVDPVPDEGPVAGLRTGLRVARGRHVAVAGCDQPFLRTPTVAALFDRAEAGEVGTGDDGAGRAGDGSERTAGAAPLVDGRRQPLGAVYPTAAASRAAERTLGTGSGALRDVLARVDPVAVPVAPGVVRDIDTRAEFASVSGGLDTSGAETTDTMEMIDELAVRTTNGTTTTGGSASERAPRTADGSTGGGS
jgi:molybdopterin-guanine dinucleotide biosynthesis protein A